MGSNDQSWDITTSIGSTAAMVAAFRAVETARPEPVIRDKYARLLVVEARSGWEKLLDPSMPARLESAGPEMTAMFQHMRGFHAARTHLIDGVVADALAAGIRQVVILAAGLDSRAYRLAWPAGSSVYEIDQPKVLAYKAKALAAHHVQPAEQRREVPIDLRRDWPAALRSAGFDPTTPTAWLVEGLLMYLPADARAVLFDRITDLSAPGSRIVADAVASDPGRPPVWERFMKQVGELGIQQTVDVGDVVCRDLSPAAVVERLTERGWQTRLEPTKAAMRRLGCWVDVPGADDENLYGAFVTGVRG